VYINNEVHHHHHHHRGCCLPCLFFQNKYRYRAAHNLTRDEELTKYLLQGDDHLLMSIKSGALAGEIMNKRGGYPAI